jgi:AraC-like DNA-binding protein
MGLTSENGKESVEKGTPPDCNLQPMSNERPQRDWMAALRDSYAIHNIVALRPELPLWVIRWDGANRLDWMELTDPHQKLKPFHFEIYFGKESLRDEHYQRAIEEASASNDVVLKELLGFWDLFYALPADGDRRTFLYAGPFCRSQPDWESLSTQWRTLAGIEPASANPDFAAFVRMALGLPVIEDELLDALRKFMKLYASFLTGQGWTGEAPRIQEAADALNREYFSNLWPIEDWIVSALSPDKFQLTPWHHEGRLTDWMKEGLGIERLPTTVMTVMPVDPPDEALDPMRTLVRNAQLQRALIAFARAMPETAATRLQDYGVAVVTSTEPGRNAPRARLELRERAQRFQTFLRERFHIRAIVGIGRTLSPGAPLHSSYRDAIVALHMCVQLEKDVLFFDEHTLGAPLRYADLQRAADALTEAFERESDVEIRLASDKYVQLVLSYSAERIEVARSQFLAMLFQLLSRIERRYPIRTEARDRFASDLVAKLEEAQSLYQVIEGFKDALARLGLVSSSALHGPKVLRLEATLQYLRENFAENLRLPEVARRAGFSVPVFTRAFKQATGTSFLSYVRSLRVEHAKRLLSSSALTTEQIAQSCGFQSQHHLLRSFKKVVGQTPGEFRRVHALRHAQS